MLIKIFAAILVLVLWALSFFILFNKSTFRSNYPKITEKALTIYSICFFLIGIAILFVGLTMPIQNVVYPILVAAITVTILTKQLNK
ncbi:MAG: hypothetical protein Q3960_01050 [Lactobacillus sp.]|nr:hypothetical protein [Lactobacillus sp.]